MKAKKLLEMYAYGKRDFRGENLRGLSFKNQDLSGVDFSDCDIRGTNFSEANLTGTKFINVNAGLTKRWVIILLLACLVFAFTAGILTILLGKMITLIYDKDLNYQIAGWFGLFIIIRFSWLSFYQGVKVGAKAIALAFSLVLAFAVAETLILAFAFTTIAGGVFIKGFFIVIAFVVTFAVGFNVVFVASFIGTVALTIPIAIAGVFGGVFTGFIATIIAITIVILIDIVFINYFTRDLVFSGALIIGITILNFYLGWRAIKGNPRDEWIREMAVNFASIGSTNFKNANLTDTDFTGAILKNVNFQKAELTRTCFKDTKNLDLACW